MTSINGTNPLHAANIILPDGNDPDAWAHLDDETAAILAPTLVEIENLSDGRRDAFLQQIERRFRAPDSDMASLRHFLFDLTARVTASRVPEREKPTGKIDWESDQRIAWITIGSWSALRDQAHARGNFLFRAFSRLKLPPHLMYLVIGIENGELHLRLTPGKPARTNGAPGPQSCYLEVYFDKPKSKPKIFDSDGSAFSNYVARKLRSAGIIDFGVLYTWRSLSHLTFLTETVAQSLKRIDQGLSKLDFFGKLINIVLRGSEADEFFYVTESHPGSISREGQMTSPLSIKTQRPDDGSGYALLVREGPRRFLLSGFEGISGLLIAKALWRAGYPSTGDVTEKFSQPLRLRQPPFDPPTIDSRRFQQIGLPPGVRIKLATGSLTNSFSPPSQSELSRLNDTERQITSMVLYSLTFEQIEKELGMDSSRVQNYFASARKRLTALRPPITRDGWIRFYRDFLILEHSGIVDFTWDEFETVLANLPEHSKRWIEIQLAGHDPAEAATIFEKELRGQKDVPTAQNVNSVSKDEARREAARLRLPIAEIERTTRRVFFLHTGRPADELDFLPPKQMTVVRVIDRYVDDVDHVIDALGLTSLFSLRYHLEVIRRAVRKHLGEDHVREAFRRARLLFAAGTFDVIEKPDLAGELFASLPELLSDVIQAYIGTQSEKEAIEILSAKRGYNVSRGTWTTQIRQAAMASRLMMIEIRRSTGRPTPKLRQRGARQTQRNVAAVRRVGPISLARVQSRSLRTLGRIL